jgi:hypothetical protein
MSIVALDPITCNRIGPEGLVCKSSEPQRWNTVSILADGYEKATHYKRDHLLEEARRLAEFLGAPLVDQVEAMTIVQPGDRDGKGL